MSVIGTIVGATIGFFLWTLVEYVGHRWVMHGSADNGLQREHRRHHSDPSDQRIASSAIYGSVALGLVFGAAWLAAAVVSVAVVPVAAGFGAGVLAYILSHQLTHRLHESPQRSRLPSPWRAHLRHHHGQSPYNFGFTTSLWDRIMKTYR